MLQEDDISPHLLTLSLSLLLKIGTQELHCRLDFWLRRFRAQSFAFFFASLFQGYGNKTRQPESAGCSVASQVQVLLRRRMGSWNAGMGHLAFLERSPICTYVVGLKQLRKLQIVTQAPFFQGT